MKTKQITLYTAIELAEHHPEVYDKVVRDHAFAVFSDSFWAEHIKEDFLEITKRMGFEITRIYFDTDRGDCSFDGSYKHRASMILNILEHTPWDEELKTIGYQLLDAQNRMDGSLEAEIRSYGRWGKLMKIDVEDAADDGSFEYTNDYIDRFELSTAKIENAVNELAHWLLMQLRSEEEWITSEDYFLDCANNSGWMFTQHGNLEY